MGRELTATSPEPFSSSSDSVIASGTTAKRTRSIFGTADQLSGLRSIDHVLIDLLAHEAERPRAHRMPPEIASAAFGNNADRARRKIGQQKIVRVLQMKDHGPRIAGFHRFHRGIGCGLGRDHRARCALS